MKITAEPRSDQWNGVDFLAGSRVFTIAGVRPGKAEQKYDIDLVEGEGRCWRPPLTVLRLLIKAWGNDSDTWIGRRVELYRDDNVTFGKDKVGGVRLAAMSHIDRPLTIALPASRNKQDVHKVLPLPDAAPAPSLDEHLAAINVADSIDALKQAWQAAVDAGHRNHPDVLAATNQRKTELSEGAEQ